MHRLTSLVVSFFCAAAVLAADDRAVTIRWHGQSFFEIVSPAGVRVVLDPHAIEAYGRKQVEADLVLMSHLHTDHTQVSVVTNADKARILPGLKEVKTENGPRQDWNPIDETLRDVEVRSVPT